MSGWPIPAGGEVAERYAVGFAAAFAADDAGVPYPEPPDTRSPNTVMRVLGVVGEESFTELYLYQRSLADELMVDTAQDWLPRHGDEWGVPRLQAQRAVGVLVVTAPAGTPLPAGIEAADAAGRRWVTVTPAVSGPDGAVAVPAQAEAAGLDGNLAAGASLALVSPVAGVPGPQAAVGDGGMQGGADLEDVEAWRARILARVRDRGLAGKLADYTNWAREAGAAGSRVLPRWMGPGTIGLPVVMAGPRTPNPQELARIAAYIAEVRPVTAELYVLAAPLQPFDVTLAVSPDTVATRAGVTTALQGFFAAATVGGALPRSRLDDAVSAASGEYAHAIAQPAGDIVPGPTAVPVLGAITFTDAAGLPVAP